MKCGFTAREAYSLYLSLAKETFRYFNYPHPRPAFTARYVLDTEYAHTDFSWQDKRGYGGDSITEMLDQLFGSGGKNRADYAQALRVNAIYLPYLYEDELIGILLHELAHVVAGFNAGHGREWSRMAQEIGGHHTELLIIRNWEDVPEDFRPPEYMVDQEGIFYLDRA